MPQNHKLASEQWERYVYARDTGHLEYLNKARRCEDFFAGYPNLQWDPETLGILKSERRPGLSINKVLSTLSSIMGEQIDLRSETAFRARYGAPSSNADTMTKLFRYISDQNQLQWLRSDMFADGAITSRGFIDIRMNFDNSVTGDIVMKTLNPRNVLPDPDAASYDPDDWGDVMYTRWMSPDEIEVMYGAAEAAALKERSESVFNMGYDSIDVLRDRFGGASTLTNVKDGDPNITRMVRVIERQHKQLSKIKYFVDLRSGDRKRIPDSYTAQDIARTIESARAGGVQLAVDEVVGQRIRWTVTADDYVLHDKWSPYRHFTIVPFFPYFRHGRTIGFVENLIDVQELLNKTTSQELHVVNTTANSGWKVRKGGLKNMTMDELEQHGSKSGLVLELDQIGDAEKIQPNQVPSGLDRLSSKAESYIKSVSARGDAQMGMARADASAKQIEANNAFGDVGLRWALDNLERTDHMIARNVMDLIQEYVTDARAMRITNNQLTGEQTEIKINWPDPETGEIMNDLTMGEYDIVIVSQPAKKTLEESQFDQLAYMKEKLGVPIPAEFLVENSNVINKTGILAALKAQAESPQAVQAAKIQELSAQLEVANLKGDAAKAEADALLKRAKAAKEIANTAEIAGQDPTKDAEMEREAAKAKQEMTLKQQKHEQDLQMQREKFELEKDLRKQEAQENARLKRAQAIAASRQAAQNPAAQPKQET
jgi:hypothetical protein